MTRKILSVFLTLLTCIGGHFINRRWDRAVFILGLMVSWSVGYFSYVTYLMNVEDNVDNAVALSISWWSIYGYGILAIWVFSLVLNLFDLRSNSGAVIGGITGYFGAAVLSIGLMLTAIPLVISVMNRSEQWENMDRGGAIRGGHIEYFHEYLNFGHKTPYAKIFESVPEGIASINGQIMFNGAPVVGVEFEVTLNDKYKTETLVSDSEGRFSIHLPEGEWRINAVVVGGWADKPEGEYMVLSGNEPRLTGDRYNEYAHLDGTGLMVIASVDNNEVAMNFEIVPALVMVWPPEGPMIGGNVEVAQANAQEDAIQWQAYKGAAQYSVKLSRIERSKNSTRSSPVAEYIVTESILPLSDMALAKADGDNEEYNVDVFAFDDTGRLISQLKSGYDVHTFTLADGNKLLDKSFLSGLGDNLSTQTLNEYHDNQKRLNAVKILIDENMLKEGETLLGKITGESKPGQLELVQGYLSAKKGECERAKTLFNKARNKAGNNCIPNSYLELCN